MGSFWILSHPKNAHGGSKISQGLEKGYPDQQAFLRGFNAFAFFEVSSRKSCFGIAQGMKIHRNRSPKRCQNAKNISLSHRQTQSKIQHFCYKIHPAHRHDDTQQFLLLPVNSSQVYIFIYLYNYVAHLWWASISSMYIYVYMYI